ncbi:glycosyltransferase family 2 protein [Candidatus Amesbacteria bacterium]|nr:glycosyltransferase family 2 protein [Candidatus Amesbacteria bacterium]
MKKINPLVSCVISTRGKAPTLDNCLRTIRNQNYKNVEIIIIAENKLNETTETAKKYNAKIFIGGVERSIKRNFGVSKARGNYVLIIDDDLELDKNVIKECIETIAEYDFLVIPELPFGSDFRAKCHRFEKMAYLDGFLPVEGARFFSRDLVQSVGGYDLILVGAEDWDLTQRLLKLGYKVGRIKSRVNHNDGKYDFIKTLKKKYYYGRVYREYSKRYPTAFMKSVFRFQILKNIKYILNHPILFIGSIAFRFVEGMAVLFGLIFNR